MILGPGLFTVFDLHEMDVPLFWRELILFPPRPPLLLNGYRNWATRSEPVFVRETTGGSKQREGSICSGICRFCKARQSIDHLCAIKLARKLHTHSFMYANKLVTTRRAIE
eukprot:410208-Pelagomonas_calceolata.AAC.1